MSKPSGPASPSWNDVKAKLVDLDCVGLISLVQDLYASSKDNKAFLHARWHLGDDVSPFAESSILRST
jgi:hypothetical protein